MNHRRPLVLAGTGFALVLAMYLTHPTLHARPSPAAALMSEDAPTFPPPPKPATAPVAAAHHPQTKSANESAPGWPKPGDPLIIPKGALSATGAPSVPVVRFDPAGCQQCLSEACNQELLAGGDLDDAIHMIGCTRLVGEEICIEGVASDRLTGITVPPLPSGRLTDATRTLIACGAQCPCWAKGTAP